MEIDLQKIKNEALGLSSAFLLATSSFHIFYSQELRPYSLPAMIAAISWWIVLQLKDNYPIMTTEKKNKQGGRRDERKRRRRRRNDRRRDERKKTRIQKSGRVHLPFFAPKYSPAV
jgi:hypothetical protein